MARQILVDILAKTKNFGKGIDQAQSKLQRFGSRAGKLGSTLSRNVTLPIIGAGVAAVKMGSDLVESQDAAISIFGKSGKAIIKWANQLESAFGLSRKEALDMVNQFRAVTKNSKLTDQQMLKLAERAADVGSLFNTASTEVGERFRAALTGSGEVLEKFGVNTKVTGAGLTKFAKSLGKTTRELTEAEKQQGIYNVIMDQTTKAQGNAKQTADTFAGSLRIMKADGKRAGETFGLALLPVLVPLAKTVAKLAKRFGNLSKGTQENIIKVALFVAAIGPLLKTLQAGIFVVKGLSVALAFLAANPIVLAIGAIAALGVGLVLLWRRSRTFRNIVRGVFRTVGHVVSTVWRNIIRPIFNSWISAIRTVIDLIRKAVNVSRGIGRGISRTFGGVLSKLPFFQTGGVVPGSPGQPRLAMVHGGERIVPRGREMTTQRPMRTTVELRVIGSGGLAEFLQREIRIGNIQIFDSTGQMVTVNR